MLVLQQTYVKSRIAMCAEKPFRESRFSIAFCLFNVVFFLSLLAYGKELHENGAKS